MCCSGSGGMTLNFANGPATLVRYVGPGLGTKVYRIGANKYLFGQNNSHRTGMVYESDIDELLSQNPKMFLLISPQHARDHKLLETPIRAMSGIDGLTRKEKTKLSKAGYQNIGQVLTCDASDLSEQTGISNDFCVRIQNNVKERFGL